MSPPLGAGAGPSSLLGLFGAHKSQIGLVLGLAVCLLVWFLPIGHGLPLTGQHCLALSLTAVIWWAFEVVHPGFTSLALLVAWAVTQTAAPTVVFGLWTNPLMYLVIGGYLLAAAVDGSGLGRRIAYLFIVRFVNSYNGVIAAAYILGFLLSFMIPHPWPRSFMIMAVMGIIIKSANLDARYAAQIGFAVFAASCPTSMVLLTGDATLNVVAMNFANLSANWLKWLYYMGVPGVVTSVLVYILQICFPAPPRSRWTRKKSMA